MQQDREGGRGGSQPQQQQQQQPQQCPRCQSLNTKFCYYNNYSLSQPRYFCKACKRYWTQGGTLRNIPVGGGCRKGKRAKTSASSSSLAEDTRSLPQQSPQQAQVQPEFTAAPPNIISSTSIPRAKEPVGAMSSGVSYYPSGRYLSSLGAIHSLNQSQPFNQLVGSSNLNVPPRFNVPLQQQQRPTQQYEFYQMDNRERRLETPYHAADQSFIQTTFSPAISSGSQLDWPQRYIMNNNASHMAPSDVTLWSTISTTSIAGTDADTSSNPAGPSPLIPNQWPDDILPGYGSSP